MLRVCRKGEYLASTALSVAEDEAMQKAFDRFAIADTRTAGAKIVRRYTTSIGSLGTGFSVQVWRGWRRGYRHSYRFSKILHGAARAGACGGL